MLQKTPEKLKKALSRAGDRSTFVRVRRVNEEDTVLRLKDVTLDSRRDSRRLVDAFSLALEAGDRFVLTGPSGSGKSSLIRAIRELWHHGEGTIEISEDAKVLCLSQETHIPRGNMRHVLSNPRPSDTYTDDEMAEVLEAVGLERLVMQLPSKQADPAFLHEKAQAFVPLIDRRCGRYLRSLDDEGRKEILQLVHEYISDKAEKFYSEDVAEYLTEDVKQDLADRMCETIRRYFEEEYNGRDPQALVLPFLSRKQTVAKQICQIMLQASARELALMTRNGKQLSSELSGGEQQKIGIARVLLQKPDIVIMDEPTSAMDPEASEKSFGLLVERLPNAIMMSVAHDEDLIKFHTLHGHLSDRKVDVHAVTRKL